MRVSTRRYARPVQTTSHHFDATGPVFYSCIVLALAGFGVLFDSDRNAAAGTTVATLSPQPRTQGARHAAAYWSRCRLSCSIAAT